MAARRLPTWEAWKRSSRSARRLCSRRDRPVLSVPAACSCCRLPGAGRSAFAKALGNELGRPTLTLDIGSLLGGLVGQSEQNVRQALRIADAMAPCVLFSTKCEKGTERRGLQRVDR